MMSSAEAIFNGPASSGAQQARCWRKFRLSRGGSSTAARGSRRYMLQLSWAVTDGLPAFVDMWNAPTKNHADAEPFERRRPSRPNVTLRAAQNRDSEVRCTDSALRPFRKDWAMQED